MNTLMQKTSSMIRRIIPTFRRIMHSLLYIAVIKTHTSSFHISSEMRQVMIQESILYSPLLNKPGGRHYNWHTSSFRAGNRASIQWIYQAYIATHQCFESWNLVYLVQKFYAKSANFNDSWFNERMRCLRITGHLILQSPAPYRLIKAMHCADEHS